MKTEAARPYRQQARARSSARTRRKLMEAAVALWREKDIDQVTLDDIAGLAGSTRQTLLRHFGSKDGLLDALLTESNVVDEERARAPVGDVPGALQVLLAHYERDGRGALRSLSVEERSDAARRIAERGRASHRAWCARVFAPFLPSPGSEAHDTRLDAFVAATDLYLWKLLRLDLGRSPEQTREVFETLVGALADLPHRRTTP